MQVWPRGCRIDADVAEETEEECRCGHGDDGGLRCGDGDEGGMLVWPRR